MHGGGRKLSTEADTVNKTIPYKTNIEFITPPSFENFCIFTKFIEVLEIMLTHVEILNCFHVTSYIQNQLTSLTISFELDTHPQVLSLFSHEGVRAFIENTYKLFY